MTAGEVSASTEVWVCDLVIEGWVRPDQTQGNQWNYTKVHFYPPGKARLCGCGTEMVLAISKLTRLLYRVYHGLHSSVANESDWWEVRCAVLKLSFILFVRELWQEMLCRDEPLGLSTSSLVRGFSNSVHNTEIKLLGACVCHIIPPRIPHFINLAESKQSFNWESIGAGWRWWMPSNFSVLINNSMVFFPANV